MRLPRRNQNRALKRTLVVLPRKDGKWSWRLLAQNGHVLATDGNQGYSNRHEAVHIAESMFGIRATISE